MDSASEPPDNQRSSSMNQHVDSSTLTKSIAEQRSLPAAVRLVHAAPHREGNLTYQLTPTDWGRQVLALTKPFVQGGMNVRQAIPSIFYNKPATFPASAQQQSPTTPNPPAELSTTTASVSNAIQKFWINLLHADTVKHLTAGGFAGAVSRTIVSPLERMKIMMQVQGVDGRHKGTVFENLAKIYREEGMMGYLRGNGANVIRIVPYSAVQFATYEYFKIKLKDPATNKLSTLRRLAAGALAGAASAVCTYPLDLVRTRLSMDQPSYSKSVKGKVEPPRMTAMMLQIWRTEGRLRGLYQGTIPTILGLAPYVALNFTAYEFFRNLLAPAPTPTSPAPTPSVLNRLACGALAGSVAQTATYPLELLRRRLQVTGMPGASYKYKGMWDAWTTIIRQEGVKGLYAGMVPNYLKVVPATAVSFVTYEFTKKYLDEV